MYTIEKNIPIDSKEKSELYRTMDSMEIWDSFFMKTIQEQNKARNLFIRWKKFSIKKYDNWFRCWRKS